MDGSGFLSYKELCQQLRKLDFTPPIHITMIDYDVITQVATFWVAGWLGWHPICSDSARLAWRESAQASLPPASRGTGSIARMHTQEGTCFITSGKTSRMLGITCLLMQFRLAALNFFSLSKVDVLILITVQPAI